MTFYGFDLDTALDFVEGIPPIHGFATERTRLRLLRGAAHAPAEPVDGVLVLVEGGLELGVGHVAR